MKWRGMIKRAAAGVLIVALIMPAGIRTAEKGDIAAVVTAVKGKLQVSVQGSDQWLFSREGDFLYEGDRLKTDQKSMASITFVNGIEVKLNKSTVFNIEPTEISDRGKGNTVNLKVGQAWIRILKEGTEFDVKTPAATVAIRGSEGDTRVRKNGRTRFVLYYGKAYVENEYGRVEMRPGSGTSIGVGSAPEEPVPVSETEQETWQDTMASRPYLRLELEKSDVTVGYPVRFKIIAIDSDGRADGSARGAVKVASSNGAVSFSTSRKGKDRAPAVTVPLKRGKAILWAFPVNDGSCVITAHADDYEPGMGRLFAFQPAKKNLELELETQDGQRKTIKLKLRR